MQSFGCFFEYWKMRGVREKALFIRFLEGEGSKSRYF